MRCIQRAPERLPEERLYDLLDILTKLGVDTVGRVRSMLQLDRLPGRQHCVRCHETYLEVDNDDGACAISHDNLLPDNPKDYGVGKAYRIDVLYACDACGFEEAMGRP